jgi:hypothetical protein
MPAKKSWLLRLTEIREELAALEVPVIDRAMVERIFHVRNRRALQLMEFFGCWRTGQALLVDRLALIEQLAPLEDSVEFAFEKQRRQRLVETLEQARRGRAASRVVLPVAAGARERTMQSLPDGVHLEPGKLEVSFAGAEDLLARLFELAQAAACDFEQFQRLACGPEPTCATGRKLTAAANG